MSELVITSTAEVAVAKLSCLIYGESGVGKTRLAATIPTGEKCLILSAESGLLSLRGTAIDTIKINAWPDITESYRLIKRQGGYRWVFIDSLTELAQRLVEHLKVRYPDRKDSMVLWGEYTDTMTGMIKAFRDLDGVNVVFTALPSVDKDGISGARFVGINIMGKLSAMLPAFFDEVFAYRIFEDESGVQKRCLVTATHDGWVAKDRSGVLKPFEQPDLGSIATRILTTNSEGV